MEDEKKKKRNKKKKNKQSNKVVEEAAVAGNGDGEATSAEQQNHAGNGQNDQNEAIAARNEEVDEPNMHQSNGTEAMNSDLAQAEKQQWLQTEQTFLQASLQETIKYLRSENDLHLQKQADLEVKLAQLQSEKESWLQKEASLEDKIGHLSEDKASLGSKQESLEEKIRQLERDYDSWILKEKSNKETISNMEMELTKLRLQVGELEESKNISIQENQRLTDIISGLQEQIQNLESTNISTARALDEQIKRSSECDVLNSQLEGACSLVERLITENSELVEKVNELYLKLDQHKVTSGHSSLVRPSSVLGVDGTNGVADRSSISSKNLPILAEKPEPPTEIVIVEDEPMLSDKGDTTNHSIVMSNSLKSEESGEIVQIPLDENEVQTVESKGGVEDDGKTAVPLTDAPLIGAPFRFISFVAGYVSGADLVDKNSRK
ncbi:EH domain-containing and endocytosis protein 1 isoform X1 [Punica granatum]|uniref:EH domain-containing and endocytosis protein 1 isoform X1 n=1 Tax=Punica granatum TaxID=22663 RepID=A0A6P8D5U0_PUNGR|nr:EH domain-containing and endocytosis protein 1 isoform X1 [Punica granatum]XP_031389869.1 EH domain-containing and endocytosis protein 1 isoform X1 [Punica granatum]